jgi:hypothetical protein
MSKKKKRRKVIVRNSNSLATFQAMMDDIFMTMIDNRLVIVYMDDILIFADTKEDVTIFTFFSTLHLLSTTFPFSETLLT